LLINWVIRTLAAFSLYWLSAYDLECRAVYG
jgi:hypothetical protein